MAKIPTLKDVAKRAGVSTATVARVLHNTGYVAEETRERVEKVLTEIDYKLNVVAQGLRKQQSLTIGHLLQTMIENPFFTQVAQGVEVEALRHSYNVFNYNVQNDDYRERLGVETFIKRRVDAIIFTTARRAENVRLALGAGVPVVQVERLTSVETSAVLIDNYVGAKEAMSHLCSLGHEHIGFIGADPARFSHERSTTRTVEEERLTAYKDVLIEQGLPVDEKMIHLGEYSSLEDGDLKNESYSRTKVFLERKLRPTAIFASSDALAAGTLQAIYELGLRVPDDISVIGFDNTYAPYLTPPLTTVALPAQEVGKVAAQLAFCQLHVTPKVPQYKTFSARLLIRKSTGPAR